MKQLFLLSVTIALLCASCRNKDASSVSSLTSAYCDCMTKNKDLPDSLRIDTCDQQILADTLSKISSDSAAGAFLDEFDTQMGKDCKEYNSIKGDNGSASSGSDDEDWKEVDTSMTARLSDNDCRDFFTHHSFSYTEPDSSGSTTKVTIDNAVWTESLKDGKYFSKLGFVPGSCSFTLSFRESNDPVKGRRSKKGESYRYKLIDKKGDHYLVLGIVKGKGLLFRLYPGD